MSVKKVKTSEELFDEALALEEQEALRLQQERKKTKQRQIDSFTPLSEMEFGRASNVMCEVVEPILEIFTDEKLIKLMSDKMEREVKTVEIGGKPVTVPVKPDREKAINFTVMQVTGYLNLILKDHKDHFFALFSPFAGVTPHELSKYNFLAVIEGVMKIIKDEAFIDFLQRQGLSEMLENLSSVFPKSHNG